MTTELKPTPQSVEMIQHKDGTGPWIAIASFRPSATTVECMGRRGDVCMIPQTMLIGEPYDVPFADIPAAQRKAYCQRFGFEIPPEAVKVVPVKVPKAPKRAKAVKPVKAAKPAKGAKQAASAE